jgi:hypothetical protein
MELVFKTTTLKKKCEKWTFFWKDAHMNKKLIQRLTELDRAPNLLDIKNRRSLYNLHPLTWDRKYQLSIDIDGRKNVFRIIFETDPKEIVCDDFMNDEQFKLVKKIIILEITNKTH